jgi:pilus assembly protein CpaE
VTETIGVIGRIDRQQEQWLRDGGQPFVRLEADRLSSPSPGTALPGIVLVDVREQRNLLDLIPNLKRSNPSIGIAIVCSTLDPELMLDAMRAGVTECIAEPITQESFQAAITRLVQKAAPARGRAHVVVGAKGGVGTTTVAVNLAQELSGTAGEVLLIDLNLSSGDAGTFLGVEPRFTVQDALENTHRLDEAFFRSLVVKVSPKLDVLAANARGAVAGPIDPQSVRTLVEFAVSSYRHVVLDVPRRDAAVLDALDTAANIFVVVNQELPAVRSAQGLIAYLRQRYGGERIALLVNRTDKQAEISEDDVRKALGTRIRHTFPSEYRQAIAAVNKGEPLAAFSKGRLAGAFHAFAQTLLKGGQAPRVDAKAPSAAPSRIFGWLAPDRSAAGR